MGEGDSSSGDDEDSDSDSSRDPGPGFVELETSPSAFVGRTTDGSLMDTGGVASGSSVRPSNVIVVSDFEIPLAEIERVNTRDFLGLSLTDSLVINISPDYRYMKMGYYVSLHADVQGNPVIPKCSDALDVYRTPILLLRASKCGIPVSPYIVSDSAEEVISAFNPPVIIFPLKPFPTYGYEVAYSKSALTNAMKRLTMSKRYTVCAQPLLGEQIALECIFGTPINIETRVVCNGEVHDMTMKLYDIFRVPFFKAYVQRSDQQLYLCGLDPMPNRRRLNRIETELFKDGILKEGGKLGC